MTKKQCPLGEDCDLTIAWMAGAAEARDRAKARIAELEAKLAKAVEALDRIGKHMVMSMAVDEGHLCRLMKAHANATLEELSGNSDLVKRLREGTHGTSVTKTDAVLTAYMHEAADRIEELEVKLAKAVEVLVLCRDMYDEVAHPSDPLSVRLNTTLAELNGDKK